MKITFTRIAFTLIICLGLFTIAAQAQTTAFTYQGKLTDTSAAANGTYHMLFRLYPTTSSTLQFGPTIENTNVSVNNGIFTVVLDFGSGINFSGLYLQISIKRPADASYTNLSPRQRLTSSPGAVRSLDANSADSLSALCELCVTDSQISSVAGSKVAGAVANATNANSATTAGNVTGIVQIANGGTGSSLKNFVDISFDQSVAGRKTFTGAQTAFTGSDGLLATGAFGSGAIPASGAGTRMMWYPRKGAFRVGGVDGQNWDDINIGNYSFAAGLNSKATGERSVAMGTSWAIGDSSVAMSAATAEGGYSIAMGNSARAIGGESIAIGAVTRADGIGSVAIGSEVLTFANFSTVMGHYVWNNQPGSFVYGDNTGTPNSNISANAPNQFVVRAQNMWFGQNNSVTATAGRFLETSTGAYLTTGGTWTNSSSRTLKTNFAPVNSRDVLRKVLQLPIQTWNYKSENANTRHIGAVSQDFHQFFKFGDSEESIATVDADGVALAAIQGLNEELNDELKDRDAKINRLEEQVKQQQALVEAMRKMLCQQNPQTEICKRDK